MARRREIDDRQAAVAEAERRLHVQPLVVGAAMAQTARHAQQLVGVDARVGVGVVQDSGDAAHRYFTASINMPSPKRSPASRIAHRG